MTPEDKAHVTTALSSPSLLCHEIEALLKSFLLMVSFFVAHFLPLIQDLDKHGEKYEACFSVRGAAGCLIGCGLKSFCGHLIGLI